MQEKIISLSARAAQAGVNPKHLKEFDIPLPTIKIQNQIVEEFEEYQKKINDHKYQISELDNKIIEKIDSIV